MGSYREHYPPNSYSLIFGSWHARECRLWGERAPASASSSEQRREKPVHISISWPVSSCHSALGWPEPDRGAVGARGRSSNLSIYRGENSNLWFPAGTLDKMTYRFLLATVPGFLFPCRHHEFHWQRSGYFPRKLSSEVLATNHIFTGVKGKTIVLSCRMSN